jgi:hypothetical protein
MTNSKKLAGLIGPVIIAVTLSETINAPIWAGNTAASVHLNGTLLFIAGLSIVRSHNYWVRSWPVWITLAGWFIIALGLFRMFAPGMQLMAAKHTMMITVITMLLLAVGIFLTFKAYTRDRSRSPAI